MERPAVKFTYQDYLQLPEDNRRWELMEGDFYVAPAPTWMHQTIVANLYFILRNFINRHNLGHVRFAPLDVVFSEADVVQPDIIFISTDRAAIITNAAIRGAPDLLVEVTSPSTGERDRGLKARLYARYGVREYWLVDTEAQTVTVLVPGAAEFTPAGVYRSADMVHSPLFPGLSFTASELFDP